MPSTTDSDLRTQAEASLAQAQAFLTGPTALPALSVLSGGDYWSDFADKAKAMLRKAANAPLHSGIKAGGKIREAVNAGLNKASEASKDARGKLAAVALGASVLAFAPLILLVALPMILGEATGFGPRARRAGRRYVEGRARAIGF